MSEELKNGFLPLLALTGFLLMALVGRPGFGCCFLDAAGAVSVLPLLEEWLLWDRLVCAFGITLSVKRKL